MSYSKDWLVYPGKITLFLMAPVVIFSYTPLHFYLYAVIGILTCVVVGYGVSLATPQWSRPTDGLNWPTRKRAVEQAD